MPTVCVIKSRKYPLSESDIVDGGTLNAFVIVKELLRKGYDVEVFTRQEEGEGELVEQPGIRVYRIPFARSLQQNVLLRDYEEGRSFVEGVLLHQAFKPERYACVHTHHWTSGVNLALGIPKQTKLIHTPHLLAAEKAHHNGLTLSQCVEGVERELLIRADHIIALSESEKAAAFKKYGCMNGKIIVASNGIDDSFFDLPPLTTLGGQELSVLFIGRFCRQKGVDVLLEGVERIARSGIPISMKLVGNPYGEPEFDNFIEKRISSAPLISATERISDVAHDQIPFLLRNCSVYVQPSRYESQGVALLEAMAAGRLVVASNLPAIREYVRHGENGYLVDPENSQALAEIFIKILSNPKQALSAAQTARETVRKYSWERMLHTVMPLFE
jgi:glycosyltransferase involved in cell wall biosynthesis